MSDIETRPGLEDVFGVYDILRKIVRPDLAAGVLTSFRLLKTSKLLRAHVQAAGYPTGHSVLTTCVRAGKKVYATYTTWWLLPSYIYAAMGINFQLKYFNDPLFWDDENPTIQTYTYTVSWGYEISTCFKILKGRKVTISHLTTGRIIDAIYGALDYRRDWFIRFLLGRVGESDAIKDIHLIGLEYVLRADDPQMLAQHLHLFSKTELDETLRLATEHNKTQLLSWFMEYPNACEMDRNLVQLRIVRAFAARMEKEKMGIDQSGLGAVIAQLHKRKAEKELVPGDAKRARIEPVSPL